MQDDEKEPFTQDELKWFAKLEKIMSQCPSKRLGCFTGGDRDLHFYDDAEYEKRIASYDGKLSGDLVIDLKKVDLQSFPVCTPMAIQGVCF